MPVLKAEEVEAAMLKGVSAGLLLAVHTSGQA